MVEPGIHRITAPSLTEVLPTYTDGELVRLLRYGVRRDGTTALLMPADTFYPMSDEHIGQIVTFLRRQPVVSGPPRVRQLSLKARLGILLGKYPLSVVGVDPSSPRWGTQPRTTPFERGRYTASTVCAECHAPSFEGDPIDGGPSLRIVGAYDLPAFRHLLRTGEPVGGPRDIGIMGEVARDAFALFRDDEIDDLYVFLRARAGLPPTR